MKEWRGVGERYTQTVRTLLIGPTLLLKRCIRHHVHAAVPASFADGGRIVTMISQAWVTHMAAGTETKRPPEVLLN